MFDQFWIFSYTFERMVESYRVKVENEFFEARARDKNVGVQLR